MFQNKALGSGADTWSPSRPTGSRNHSGGTYNGPSSSQTQTPQVPGLRPQQRSFEPERSVGELPCGLGADRGFHAGGKGSPARRPAT